VKQFAAEPDIQKQKDLSGQIETLLLDETPIIFAYFYNYLSASLVNVTGAVPSAIGHYWVDQATVA
jgi:peptide/nickel transport system substrate-binding protein